MPAVVVACPGLARAPLRADGLPTEVAPGRAEHLHCELRLIRGEDIGVDIACVDELAARKPVAGGQVLVDGGEGGVVGSAGGGGGDVDDEVRSVGLTRFREMELVAQPTQLVSRFLP